VKEEHGQTLVLVAAGAVAFVGMLLLVINGGALIQARMAMSHAVENAAVAALRTGRVGEDKLNPSLADEQARNVLRVELGNVHGLRQSPGDVADSATINVNADQVDIAVTADVCPPAWLGCFPMSLTAAASLSTSLPGPLPAATDVPPVIIPIVSP